MSAITNSFQRIIGPTTSIGGGEKFSGGGYTKSGRSFREMEEEERNKRTLEERMNPLLRIQREGRETALKKFNLDLSKEQEKRNQFFGGPQAQMTAATRGSGPTWKEYEDRRLWGAGLMPRTDKQMRPEERNALLEKVPYPQTVFF